MIQDFQTMISIGPSISIARMFNILLKSDGIPNNSLKTRLWGTLFSSYPYP
jgi:hypothetical protein